MNPNRKTLPIRFLALSTRAVSNGKRLPYGKCLLLGALYVLLASTWSACGVKPIEDDVRNDVAVLIENIPCGSISDPFTTIKVERLSETTGEPVSVLYEEGQPQSQLSDKTAVSPFALEPLMPDDVIRSCIYHRDIELELGQLDGPIPLRFSVEIPAADYQSSVVWSDFVPAWNTVVFPFNDGAPYTRRSIGT